MAQVHSSVSSESTSTCAGDDSEFIALLSKFVAPSQALELGFSHAGHTAVPRTAQDRERALGLRGLAAE